MNRVLRGRPAESGMTLLEVLTAASFFLIILAGIVMLIMNTRRLQIHVEDRESAMFHLEAVAERIAATTFSNIPYPDSIPGAPYFPADGSDVSPQTGVTLSLANESITVTYPGWDWDTWVADGQDSGDIPDPLTIRLQVTWNESDRGTQQTETLTVVRSAAVNQGTGS